LKLPQLPFDRPTLILNIFKFIISAAKLDTGEPLGPATTDNRIWQDICQTHSYMQLIPCILYFLPLKKHFVLSFLNKHTLYVARDCDKVIIDLRTVIVFTFYCKNFVLSPKTSIS